MSLLFQPEQHAHRRYNPLTGDWVVVSPHRSKRPWQGQVDMPNTMPLPSYDETCYLCPGNRRLSGEVNPHYPRTFVFSNDFPAFQYDTPKHTVEDDLFRLESISGLARVLCFSPNHSLTLPEMTVADIEHVVVCWAEQEKALADDFQWIQIFENKGAIMGCSMPHPHGQIWAQRSLPTLIFREVQYQQRYFEQKKSPLLVDYATKEMCSGERVVLENQCWLVVVPYWAAWPFETLLLPKTSVQHLYELSAEQRMALAAILQALTIRYDNLFSCAFPYSMGWHGAPTDGELHPECVLHAHFYPPLLRSAEVKKFMVGYEMLAEVQRDLTPEQAAQRLRSVPDVHYRHSTHTP